MNIQFFLKFGQLENVEQLRTLGRIYINQAKFFKKDHPHGMYDKNEGRLSMTHLKDTFIEISPTGTNQWKKLNVKTGVWNYSLNTDHCYIYSLFSILESETRKNEYFEFSNDIKQMGNAYLIISNPKEFMKRLLNTLDQNPVCYKHGIIEYYNPLEDQNKLGLFHKADNYQYQKEYRIVVEQNPANNIQEPDHLQFDIGNLGDISEICTIDQHKGLQFQWQ